MKRESVPPSAGAPRQEDKSQDDREFKARWIRFGMWIKAKADGYGIDWRNQTFENLIKEISKRQNWARPQEEECAM